MGTPARLLIVAALAAPALAACADDGAGVQTGSAVGSASGTESSGSLAEQDLTGTSDDALVQSAVTAYATQVRAQAAGMVPDVKLLTDAVRAGNLEAAKAAYAPSRQRWERIEPVAGLVEGFDAASDSRVDDFSSPDDAAFTGWHRIEYLLWEKEDVAGAKPFADKLDAEVARLQTELPKVDITAAAVALGAGELIEEVSKGKITGEEDRYSHTDLWDFAANVEGAKDIITLLTPALQKLDPALLTTLNTKFAAVDATLGKYRDGNGWKPYTALTPADRDTLKAGLGGLSESLAQLPGKLGIK